MIQIGTVITGIRDENENEANDEEGDKGREKG